MTIDLLQKNTEPVLLPVTYLPQGQTLYAAPGETLLDAALQNGIDLPHECGGNCACTTCHVHILQGTESVSPPEEVEIDRLSSAENLQLDSRLACQAIIQSGAAILLRIDSPPV